MLPTNLYQTALELGSSRQMLGCCYNHDGIQICTASEVGRRPSPVGKKNGVYLWMRRRPVLLGSKVIESVGEIKPRYILFVGRWKEPIYSPLILFFPGTLIRSVNFKTWDIEVLEMEKQIDLLPKTKRSSNIQHMPLILSQCHSALSEVVWDEVLCIFVVKLMSQTGHVRILQPVASTYRQRRVDTGGFIGLPETCQPKPPHFLMYNSFRARWAKIVKFGENTPIFHVIYTI